jgi:hypothetical protein
MPGRYRKEPAKDAWNVMVWFLKKCFDDRSDAGRITWHFEAAQSSDYDFKKNVRLE